MSCSITTINLHDRKHPTMADFFPRELAVTTVDS